MMQLYFRPQVFAYRDNIESFCFCGVEQVKEDTLTVTWWNYNIEHLSYNSYEIQ